MLRLDENILVLLKLTSLIDTGNPVPARECVNRNSERLLILQKPKKKYHLLDVGTQKLNFFLNTQNCDACLSVHRCICVEKKNN